MNNLTPRQRCIAVLIAGCLVRLAIFATSVPKSLERRPELSTPLTSIRSLTEGGFIFDKGSNPYLGGVFHHSPLYLALPRLPLVWVLADALGALALARLSGSTAAGLYLFNPYAILSCLARSTTSVDNAMLLMAIAASGDIGSALLAVASHTSLYPVLLVPPFIMLAKQKIQALATFVLVFVTIAAANCWMFGTSWIGATWGVIVTVSDLTPNVGMWWYFFTEMFDHFRAFFLGVFQLHTLVYVAPVCLRLQHDPLVAILVLVGVFSTWKSYPTLGDTALWAGLLGCFRDVTKNLRHPLFILTVSLYTLILLPLLHSLWLLTGTGNANFFYAATMVHGLNSSLAVVDILTAALRRDIRAGVTLEIGWRDLWNIVQFTRA